MLLKEKTKKAEKNTSGGPGLGPASTSPAFSLVLHHAEKAEDYKMH